MIKIATSIQGGEYGLLAKKIFVKKFKCSNVERKEKEKKC